MANLLNFAHWKVKSHKNGKAVLTHKDGHFMTIATGSLPRLQQEQIKKLASDTREEQHLADGGDVEAKEKGTSALDTLKTIAHDATPWGSIGAAADSIKGNYASNPDPAPVDPPLALAGSSTTQPPAPEAAPSAGPDIQAGMQGAVNQEARGVAQGRDVEKALVPANQQILKENVDARQTLLDDTNTEKNELAKHAQDYSDYTNQHPTNANSYLERQTGGQQVLQAIGLFLGGLGGHGKNPALDFLNKQIDRDIDAQKSQADRQHNVWGAYHQLYGDQQIANSMTRIALNDQLLQKAAQAKAQLGTQQAEANYNQLQGAIQKKNLLELGVAAQRSAALKNGLAQPDPHAPTAAAEQRREESKLAPELRPILAPGHENAYSNLIYDPKSKPHAAELEKEYVRAKQADKILAQLPEAFKSLAGETNGAIGYAHRKLGHLGAVAGGALGSLVGHPAAGATVGEGLFTSATGMSDQNRAYDTDRAQIANDISSALGGALGVEGAKQEIEASLPEAGDSPEVKRKKLANVAKLIKNNVSTGLLSTIGKGKIVR